MKKLMPTEGKLILKPLEEKQAGRVILPTAIKDKNIFEIVNTHLNSPFSVGQLVVPRTYQGMSIDIEKEEFVICEEKDIWAIFE